MESLSRKNFLKITFLFGAGFLASCEGMELDSLPAWSPPVIDKYFPLIARESSKYNIDPAYPVAIMLIESGGFSEAKSHANAKGLMQIIPSTADFTAQRMNLYSYNLFNPSDNISMGINYLAFLRDHYGDMDSAICHYYGQCQGYLEWINNLFEERNYKHSPTFEKWLSAINNTDSICGGKGGLLKCAFEEQHMDYHQWNNNRDKLDLTISPPQQKLYCRMVKAPEGLPSLIHPGEKVGDMTVRPGGNAWSLWNIQNKQNQGKSNYIEVCQYHQ